ncbi:hypothetical protein J42TS3_18260 [Paenibacillus vini]|uniref:Uncharacterized protein n=1 Tax=Paenibacillus vini TaxID=1476024 RepID=A0ABQ4M9X2_9BACL|nr:hypothetical protein J42TS3_18260 [Paenibacillus vini]
MRNGPQHLQHRIKRLLGRPKKPYRQAGRKADGAADQKSRRRAGDADSQMVEQFSGN